MVNFPPKKEETWIWIWWTSIFLSSIILIEVLRFMMGNIRSILGGKIFLCKKFTLPGPLPLNNSSGSQILGKQKYTQRIPHPSREDHIGSRLEVPEYLGCVSAYLWVPSPKSQCKMLCASVHLSGERVHDFHKILKKGFWSSNMFRIPRIPGITRLILLQWLKHCFKYHKS